MGRKLVFGALLGAFLLTGCVGRVKEFNDTAATALIQSICAMTVGAFNRLENPNDKRGVDLLCGGDGEDPVTLKDLNLILSVEPAE